MPALRRRKEKPGGFAPSRLFVKEFCRPFRAWEFCGRLTQGVARRLALPWAIFSRAFSPSQSANSSTVATTNVMLHLQHKLVLRHAVQRAQLPVGVPKHVHPPPVLADGHQCLLPHPIIPTGFRPKAQGCAERATLGHRPKKITTPTGLCLTSPARQTKTE